VKNLEKLGEGGFRGVLAGIEVLATDVDYESFPKRAVEAVATAINVDFISYNEVDLLTGAKRFRLKPDPEELDPATFEYAAFVRRFGNHPVVAQRVITRGSISPDRLRFVNRVRLLGMVGNCCGQAELRLNLGLKVSEGGNHRVGIAVHRSVRDFDDRDAAALDLLRPHIVSAYRNALRHRDGDKGTRDTTATASTTLTKRENEVLYWVSMGKTNGEVGDIIGARPMTVKKHLEHIYDKLGVPNRTAAARMTAGSPGR
jgi:DNA-binding CsgD family transcriptional regulator